MFSSLASNVMLVSFPWRNVAFSSSPISTHFTPRFDFSPIFHTRIFSSVDVAKEVEKDDSFTVSYLINSCGLSSESAKLVSKHVRLKDSSKPDSVLDCFRNYGFSDAHIKRVVRGYPKVLIMNPEKKLKPKMEFFLSIGVKGEDFAAIICRNPILLSSSLNETTIPFYDFLKKVLVHDELVVRSLKSSFRSCSVTNAVPNFELLKKVGVPDSNIQFILINAPGLLGLDYAKFSKRVNSVIDMGFDPSKLLFLEAIKCWPTKSTWERKAHVCRSWGWSDSDVSFAFRKNPLFMRTSVEKFTAVMDFLVNKMGWDPSAVADASYVFNYSLMKNIIPKCSVIRVLILKGLIADEVSLSSILPYDRKRFLDRFVLKYLKQVPELLEIYEGEVDLSELGFGFEEKLDTKLK